MNYITRFHLKKKRRHGRDARVMRSIWSKYKLPSLSQSNDITHERSGYATRLPLSCRETPDAHINMEKKFDSPKRRDHQEKVHVTRFPASARVGPVWEICEASAQSPTIASYHIFLCRCHCSLFAFNHFTSGIF